MGLDLALRGAPLQLSDFGRPLTPDEQLAAEQTRAEMTSTPGRAWKSAGLGAKAASLWDAANAAYIDNDLERAQQLEAQAKEYGQRAGIMAVPIQETKDINGVGDAVDYARHAAALAVTRHGAQAGMPHHAEVMEMMRRNG